MNRAALHFINKYLSDYLENISKDQLEVSIFSGKITMENVKVKSHVLQMFGFPFELKFAKLGKINISYSLSGILSKPVKIEISDIFAFISPVQSSDWSESTLKDLLIKTKQMKLDQFEALQDSDMGSANIPDFLKRWLIKIIDNVQLSIEKLYLRYEDSITGLNNFNFGVILKGIKASTCNSNWEKTLNPNSKSTLYKILEVEKFAVFNDFEEENSIFQKKYIGELEAMFELLVIHEMNDEVKHNYIVEPFNIEAKVMVNKSLDKSSPLITVEVNMDKFISNVYDGQIRSGLQILELIKLFLKFLVGVDKTNNFKELDDEEQEKYRELYSKLRNLVKHGKNTEKTRKKLIELEKDVNYTQLIELRESVITNIIKSKLIKVKEKEIAKIDQDFRGKWANFKSAFSKLSELEYEEREQEVNAKIDVARKEIEKIHESTVIPQEKKKEQDDWLKVFIKISIGCISLCMHNENSPLFKLETEDINLVLGLKTGIFLEFRLASTRLIDLSNPHAKFPYFLDMGKVSMYLEDDPLLLDFTGGDIFVYVLTKKILNIASILKDLFVTKADISEYAQEIFTRYTHYIREGQDFIKVLFNEGQVKLPSISVKCKAPVIVFPGNLEVSTEYLVINSGEIMANTVFAYATEVHYYFELANFTMYIVSSGVRMEEKTEYLLSLEMISTNFWFNASTQEITLDSNLDDIAITVNPKTLVFLDNLQKNLAKVIPKIMVVQAFKSQVSTEFLNDCKPFPQASETINVSRPPAINNFNTLKTRGQSEGVSVKIAASVRKAYLKVIDDGKDFFEIGASKILCIIEVAKTQQVSMEYKVKEFYLKDLKDSESYLKVVYDPYPKPQLYQITLKISIYPETLLTHLSISVDSIRVTIFSKFIEDLLKYYKKNYEVLKLPAFNFNVPTETPAYTVNSSQFLQMSIICHKVEFWFPAKESKDCVSFELTSHLDFKSNMNSRVTYSDNDLPINSVLVLMAQEMDLLASHFSASLIKTDGTNEPELIMNPSRAKLQMEMRKSEEYELDEIRMNIDVEPMEMGIKVQQIDSFVCLGFDWMFFLVPGVFVSSVTNSKMFMTLNVGSFDLTLGNKTDNLEYLGKVELRQAKVSLNQSGTSLKVKCQSSLAVNLYNRRIAQWQACIEKFPVLLDLSIEGPDVHPDIRVYDTINVNVSYDIVELALEVLEYFLKGAQKKMVKEEQVLIIENHSDQNLFVSIGKENLTENWKIPLKDKLVVNMSEVEEINKKFRGAVKWTHSLELNQKNIQVGFSFKPERNGAKFILLNERMTKLVNIDGKNLLIQNQDHGNSRVIIIQNSIFVVDFTKKKSKLVSITENEFQGELGFNYPLADENISIQFNSVVCSLGGFNIIVEHYDVELSKTQICKLIEIKPEFMIKNSLCENIQILDKYLNIIQTINSGSIETLVAAPGKKYFIRFTKNEFEFDTILFDLPCQRKQKKSIKIENYPESSIMIKVKKTDPKINHILKDCKKTLKYNKFLSMTLEVYSNFIMENLSQTDLQANGLLLKQNSSIYYSGSTTRLQLKTLNESSKTSDFFIIDTVGMSGALEIEHLDLPTNYIGVKILQLEGDQSETKKVVFTPRYLIWNFLSVPVHVTIDEISIFQVDGKTEEEQYMVLDGFDKTSSLHLSLNKVDWTLGIKVDEIHDFQVKVKHEVEEIMDNKAWFLPDFINDYFRFVRVVITSEDGATLHISLIDPVDPDFRIVNKTDEPLFVRQVDTDGKETCMVPPYESRAWTWQNHLLVNKKVKISYLGESRNYSLEKVKSYKEKELGDTQVSVNISGSTREVWVKGKRFNENKSRSSNQFFVITKETNEHHIVNPRFGIQGSLVPLNELLESMSNPVVESVASKQSILITSTLSHICINLFSSDFIYSSGVSLKNLQVAAKVKTFQIQNKTKIRTDAMLKISLLSVFQSNQYQNSTSNILEIVKGPESESIEFTINHEVIIKFANKKLIDQKHKFDNFELLIGPISVNVTDEILHSMLSYLDYFKLIQPYLALGQVKTADLSKPDFSSFASNKVYFRRFKLGAIQLSIIIHKYKKRLDFSQFANIYLFSLLRMTSSMLLSGKPVNLSLDEVVISNAFQNIEHFGLALGKKYLYQGISQAYKVLGFLDILANPLKIIHSMGTAVYELIAEPSSSSNQLLLTSGLNRSVKAMTMK